MKRGTIKQKIDSLQARITALQEREKELVQQKKQADEAACLQLLRRFKITPEKLRSFCEGQEKAIEP